MKHILLTTILALFISLNAAAQENPEIPIHDAARLGNLTVLQKHINAGTDVNFLSPPISGYTPLMVASLNGRELAVKLLIDNGADVNIKSENGSTALHEATRRGREKIVKLLIDNGANVNGANVNTVDEYGRSPLSLAVILNYKRIAELLVSNGADLESKDLSGNTLLINSSYSATKDHHAAPLLVLLGANVNAKNNDGFTALSLAAYYGREGLAQLLIDNDAEINTKNNSGRTPLYWAARQGHKGLLQLLISNGADLHEKDNWGYNPITAAANWGHKEIVEILISKDADVNSADDYYGRTPLSCAAGVGHTEVVELLIINGANVNSKDTWGKTALDLTVKKEILELLTNHGGKSGAEYNIHLAAKLGNYDAIIKHLNSGVDVNLKDEAGRPPLHIIVYSCENQSVITENSTEPFAVSFKKIAELLISSGADVNAKDDIGQTPLHVPGLFQIAADKTRAVIVEQLINNGADVNARSDTGSVPLHYGPEADVALHYINNGADVNAEGPLGTPLHTAVGKSLELSKILILNGADVNANNYRGSVLSIYYPASNITPLQAAVGAKTSAEFPHLQIIQLLIENGANVNEKDSIGRTSLDFTTGRADSVERAKRIAAVVELLLAKGGEYGADQSIHVAAHTGNIQALEKHLSSTVKVDIRKNHYTPLLIATRHRHEKAVKLLISHGADVNAKSEFGHTSLHHSANHYEIAKMLIDAGADVNSRDYNQNTPLHSVDVRVAELLIANGADVNAKNEFGETPLFKCSSVNLAELLIANGADVNVRDQKGNTVLHNTYNLDLTVRFIQKGINVNAKNSRGEVPLFYPISVSIAEILIENGAKINEIDIDGLTALDSIKKNYASLSVSSKKYRDEIIQFLLNNGAISQGGISIHVSAIIGDIFMLLNHLDAGADVNSRDYNQNTPLHLAVKHKSKEAAEFLISKGANINARNVEEKIPLHLASHLGEIAKKLIEAGSDVNSKDKFGITPLHYAATQYPTIDVKNFIMTILSKGADMNLKVESGELAKMTPLELAIKADSLRIRKNAVIVNLLKNYASIIYTTDYSLPFEPRLHLKVQASLAYDPPRKWKLEHSLDLKKWHYSEGPFNKPMIAGETRTIQLPKPKTGEETLVFRLRFEE